MRENKKKTEQTLGKTLPAIVGILVPYGYTYRKKKIHSLSWKK